MFIQCQMKTEKTAGISYVAISRVKTLYLCVIEPMTFERLTNIKKSKHLKFKDEEEKRLHDLAKLIIKESDGYINLVIIFCKHYINCFTYSW